MKRAAFLGHAFVCISLAALLVALSMIIIVPMFAHAQTTNENQLRATILAEIKSDPRSQNLSQEQLYSLVNALTLQAEQQGLTASALQYRPTAGGSGAPTSGTTFANCSDVSCSLSYAFGLNGSLPIIPIALFIAAALFILIYAIMREMGHPHAKF